MRDSLFLSVVDERHTLLEEEERSPYFEPVFVGNKEPRARLVVVLEEAELDVVVGEGVLLTVERVGVGFKAAAAVEVCFHRAVDVVVVRHVERLKNF